MLKPLLKFPLVLFASIMLALIVQKTYGQTQRFMFSYDASGNRTERIISLDRSSSSNLSNSELTNPVEFNGIKIYPNPTKGLLKIEIEGYELGTIFHIDVFDIKGAIITSIKTSDTITEINLSDQKTGIYILSIATNKKTYKWKIIKD
ncbi:hypothetical protein DSECCO2_453290 [anaerobic digester metagenome]